MDKDGFTDEELSTLLDALIENRKMIGRSETRDWAIQAVLEFQQLRHEYEQLQMEKKGDGR